MVIKFQEGHICPNCGAKTDVPQLFPPKRQQIFAFIWANPNCLASEVQAACYNYYVGYNTVVVHINKIGEALKGSGYALRGRVRLGDRRRLYKIIKEQESKDNVTTNVPAVLS
jgi:hypothetical protein